MKITTVYTRRGDTGMTDLIGGIRIKKNDIRLEAYGTIDELSSHLGLLLTMMDSNDEDRPLILRIQNDLFNVGTHLATDQSQTPLYDSARLPEGETQLLEQAIDRINALLPGFQGFVLPGGTQAAAQCHVCRTVCRRAERRIDSLMETAVVGSDIVTFINRLSDYLFVLAKKINFNAGHSEILWKNVCK
jgi:cob(I)alamin adenosyltransferase